MLPVIDKRVITKRTAPILSIMDHAIGMNEIGAMLVVNSLQDSDYYMR